MKGSKILRLVNSGTWYDAKTMNLHSTNTLLTPVFLKIIILFIWAKNPIPSLYVIITNFVNFFHWWFFLQYIQIYFYRWVVRCPYPTFKFPPHQSHSISLYLSILLEDVCSVSVYIVSRIVVISLFYIS